MQLIFLKVFFVGSHSDSYSALVTAEMYALLGYIGLRHNCLRLYAFFLENDLLWYVFKSHM